MLMMNQYLDKILKGCGCLTIGGVAMMMLAGIVGTCVDDDKEGETEKMAVQEKIYPVHNWAYQFDMLCK